MLGRGGRGAGYRSNDGTPHPHLWGPGECLGEGVKGRWGGQKGNSCGNMSSHPPLPIKQQAVPSLGPPAAPQPQGCPTLRQNHSLLEREQPQEPCSSVTLSVNPALGAWVPSPTLPLTKCVTLNESHHLSSPSLTEG